MAQLVDNLIAFRILSMLVTPFEETQAYKLGIIDGKGNPQKKLKDMTWTEKDQYSMLHRMVFRIKRIMEKVPGLGSKLGTLATAYFLVRECVENKRSIINLEEDYNDLLTKIRKEDIILCEEFLLVEKFLTEELPANVTGSAVSTEEPVVRKKAKQIRLLKRIKKA